MCKLSPIFFSVLTLSSLSTSAVTMANTMPDIPKTHLAQTLNCNNANNQSEINKCAFLSYQNADKTLNQVYQKLLPQLDKSRQKKLMTAQQAWIKFRDASCEFEKSENEGGSLAPTTYFACLARTTKQRTQQLQQYRQP